MTEPTPVAARTPWHLWVVGALSLLWNAVGAMDFTMTQMKSEAYLKALTPEQQAYLAGFPLWAVLAWGVGTWGSLLGSLVLLLRRKFATVLFVASALGVVVTHLHTFVLSDGMKVMKGGAGAIIFGAVIFVIVILLILYSRAMSRRGVLR